MDIRLLKLVTGEDVIANVEEIEGNTWTLKNPTKIMATPEGVGMGPLHPFLKEGTVAIDAKHIVYQGPVETEIQNAYNSQFGSGIVTAPASALNLVGLPEDE